MMCFDTALISSLEIVASKMMLHCLGVADSGERFMSAIKSSTGSWEQPQTLPKLVAKT